MFKNPFSFEGRIRRTEFGLSFMIYVPVLVIISLILESGEGSAILALAVIPLQWFLWAQGAKRCHDVGISGWWQLLPFAPFYLIYKNGQPGQNQYGENPKGIQAIGVQTSQGGQNTGTSGGYQGGYSGGHNNPTTNYTSTENPSNSGGYRDGDLYK